MSLLVPALRALPARVSGPGRWARRRWMRPRARRCVRDRWSRPAGAHGPARATTPTRVPTI